jgi:hypothetical protein
MQGPSTPAVLSPQAKAFQKTDVPVPEEYVKQVLGAEQLRKALAIPKTVEPEKPPPRRPGNPIGACSFFFASVALLVAQVTVLSFLAVPLGCVGLVLGLVGILLALDLPDRGWVLSAGGTALSVAVVGIVFLFPGVFGLPSAATSADESAAPHEMVVTVEGGKSVQRGARDDEWVDAGKESLQQGHVRIRVTSVRIRRFPIKDRNGSSRSSPRTLAVGLRLINANGARTIAYRSWQGSSPESARLEDDRGKTYATADLKTSQEIAGHIDSADLSPGRVVTDVLVFEAPRSGIKFLRLELPASAFGGTGTLRLQIPASMVVEP